MNLVIQKQWQMQYSVNLVGTGYMEDEQILNITIRLGIDLRCSKCKDCHENVDLRKK